MLYELFDKSFPLLDRRIHVIEDLAGSGFGEIGRVWFGSRHGLLEWSLAELEEVDRKLLHDGVEALRRQLLATRDVRALAVDAARSRAAHERLKALERQLARDEPRRRELARLLVEAASRYGPDADDTVVPVEATLARPAPAPQAPRPPTRAVPSATARGSGSGLVSRGWRGTPAAWRRDRAARAAQAGSAPQWGPGQEQRSSSSSSP